MASNQELTIPLKYWVDSEQKGIVMAETSGDFVDVLFSLLTLPLGTIIRLGNKFGQPVKIGCINNLYQSVKRLTDDVFWNNTCKEMLLSPRNPLEESLKRLKVKVDDTEPTKYFMCHSCSSSKGCDLLLSTFDGARCYCGKLMRKEMELRVESKEEPAGNNGVFVKEDAIFLILDDLRVLGSSPSDSLQLPLQRGYKNFGKIEGKSRDIGAKEIFSILKHALTSESPLSDEFFKNGESNSSYSFSPNTGPVHREGSVEIKVIVSKSQNKILFVEADGDFVDILVSFLTTPLGSIMNLMNGKLSLGSIDNLYTSVKNLNPLWFIGSSNKSLLNPRIAPQFGCKNNPLNTSQEDTHTHKYWCGTEDNTGRTMISKRKDTLRDPTEMKIFEPRCCDGGKKSAVVGFMKRPCLFVVKDDLEVKPMTNSSCISYLQQMNVKLNDLEEHLVEINKSHEVLNLLMASLTSKGAFTRSLFYLLMKWKCQRCISFCGILGWKEKNRKRKKKKQKDKVWEVISKMMITEKERAKKEVEERVDT